MTLREPGFLGLIYENTKTMSIEQDALDDDVVDAWAPNLGDDGLFGNNAPVMNREDDARSGSSSPDSIGSFETSISSHFGGINYPSLFSSKPSTYGSSQSSERVGGSRYSAYEGPGSPIREPPPYSSPDHRRYESFENPLATGSRSFDEGRASSGAPQFGKALYDFTAGGADELNLTADEEVEIEDEVDSWYYVRKKRPRRDGKMAGLVPVLYVSRS